jgi:glutamyl/glutaminyl-tRNA synthetase
MMTKPKTRFAPTPSGYLHLGNVYNALACQKWAKENNAKLVLRIDDIDRARFRIEYLEDIFKTMDWLGIEFDEGPSGVEDFLKNYSQHTKIDLYKKYLEPVSQDTFSCECSRKDLLGTDHYPGTCRDKNLTYKEDLNLRLKPMDVIIYKKDLLPSYHWSCVIDDYEMNITHLIRGEDLIPSTNIQKKLREKLNLPAISSTHHPLVTDESGQKISKSTLKNGVPLMSQFSKKDIFLATTNLRDIF